MPSDKMRLLGIGKDEDMEKEREAEYYTLQGKLELRRLKAETITAIWDTRLNVMREQYSTWADVVREKWQLVPVLLGLVILGFGAAEVATWILAGLLSTTSGFVGTWPTGYTIVQGDQDVPYYEVQHRDAGQKDWLVYTPALDASSAQHQLEQLRVKNPLKQYRLKSIAGENKPDCFTVVLESKFAAVQPVSPCFANYGQALATLNAFQEARATKTPLTVPDVDFSVPLVVLPDVAPLPEPKTIEKVVTETVYSPPETTVIVVPADPENDYWVPYAQSSQDVDMSILEDLVPDNVFYVVP